MPFEGPAGQTQGDAVVGAATAAEEQLPIGPSGVPVSSRELRLAGGLSRLTVIAVQTAGTVPATATVELRISNVWFPIATLAFGVVGTVVSSGELHVGGATAARVTYPMAAGDEVYSQRMLASST